MVNGISITIYESTDPQRVFWVVLRANLVEGSGMEYAPTGALQAALDEALEKAREVARRVGLPGDTEPEYWKGVWAPR